ncbi:hypothetical protein [Bosea sp. (in: a-proteobacteria)]
MALPARSGRDRATAAPGEEPLRDPDRMLPKNAEAAVKIRERTPTNL